METFIMAIDQGTTSSRAILFRKNGEIAGSAAREFPQIFPAPGLVEHDPMMLFSTTVGAAYEALLSIGAEWSQIAAIGITNQRETVMIWEKETGTPIHNAIVWQCRRTAGEMEELKKAGLSDTIREKTGLLLDPYFSASKAKWILDHVPGARERAKRGELCFGTVDTWLLFKFSGGKIFATDVSNASRTMLFNIHTLSWDEKLLRIFDIPKEMLPEIRPSSCLYGYTDPDVVGARIPIAGVVGDQQAALFGQCCFTKGALKNTYGTGGFLLMNTGDTPVSADNGLLSTVAWSIGGKVTYAAEGSVFVAGAAIQWLRDGLRLVESSADSEYMARKVKDSGGVIVVPAFTGLGAPYWDAYARGTILGITRSTTKYHLIRATLESIAFETADVVRLLEETVGTHVGRLRVDGGASSNNLLLEMQADILGCTIERPAVVETTALGAAYLAGLAVGIYADLEDILKNRKESAIFTPKEDDAFREKRMKVWHKAVRRAAAWESDEE